MMIKLVKNKLVYILKDLRGEFEILPEELLTMFAKSLVPHIRAFYESKEGQDYFKEWLKKHPKSNKDESAHSTNQKLKV